ncbi:MAG: hypothetical protein LBD34_01570, partial [Puniceicoccales bacterium]|nr:hypothetical protein [Puniceicoccales bacterium]
FITENDFVGTRAELLDTEGFVNYTRQIDGVKVGAFLEFHGTDVKCSLRSKDATWRMDLLAQNLVGVAIRQRQDLILNQKTWTSMQSLNRHSPNM